MHQSNVLKTRWKLPFAAAFMALLFATPLHRTALCQQEEVQEVEGEAVGPAEAMIIQDFALVDGFAAGGQSRNYMLAVKKLDVLLQLEGQVEVLKSVCGITDAQIKKLNVASKGVAQRQAKKWAKEMDQFQMWGMAAMNAEANGEPKKDEEEEEKAVDVEDVDLDKIDPSMMQWLTIDFSGQSNAKPTDDKIWKKAVRSVLDDGQREKLAAYRKSREKQLREATVQFFAQTYGTQLLLNDEQLAKFSEAIKKQLADQTIATTLDGNYQTLMQMASIPSKTLNEIMSPSQIKRWKILLGPYNGGIQAWVEDADVVEEIDEADPATESNGDDG